MNLLLCVLMLCGHVLLHVAQAEAPADWSGIVQLVSQRASETNTTEELEVDPLYKNNFYVILMTSKFYLNFRHTNGAMSIYKHLKDSGIPDDQIILMLPDNHACNARYIYQGTAFSDYEYLENMYCDGVQVDYRAEDITLESILNLFRGRYDPNYPETKKLKTNSESKIFVFMNGHSGDQFIKIQDKEQMFARDIARVLSEMHSKGMFKEMFIVFDTCQASTLFEEVEIPNVILMGTSVKGQSSFTYHHDETINQELTDRFAYMFFYQFIRNLRSTPFTKETTFADVLEYFPWNLVESNLRIKSNHNTRRLSDIYLHEYIPLPKTNLISKQIKEYDIGETPSYAHFLEG